MAMDYVIPARRSEADESVGHFVRRRVGREAFERMAEPLLSGIYAGDADRLSLLSTFPRLRQIEREHGSVIKGAIAQRRQAQSAAPASTAPHHTPFVSLAGGLGELVDALAERISPAQLHLRAPVVSVSDDGAGVTLALTAGTPWRFDGALIATPAPAAAAMLAADAALDTALRAIPYVSSATISLAFNAIDISNRQCGRGFVIPRAEGRALTAVTWTSHKFGGRAPESVALLRGFAGRAGSQEVAFLPDDDLIALARTELHDILGIDAEPILARVHRWPDAMPQYILGHQETLAAIDRSLAAHPRLALTGAAYRGVGIPDCISDATAQASALADRLTG
jgi:oxygen-dependent protoporphyrinogen oxidase